MKIRANCAARTVENDIRPIAEIVQKTGLRIEAATFIGSSPIRRFTENWTDDFLLQTTEKAVKYAVSLGLDVMYVTEDTSRCDPETVKRLYSTAISCGARAIVICDTAGHATPVGALALVRFVIEEVVKPSGEKVRVDWHGHSDRGLAIANSMAAIIAGANCVHGCAIGLGERVGNTQVDQMLVNLKLMGIAPWDQQDLTKLKQYCQAVSRATGVPIPANYPVVGDDAFRTATGVHAAAIIKAYRKSDVVLANTVYSGVPSHLFGLEQIIDIGPMSGKSNVLYWLEKRGVAATDDLVERIYQRAKGSDHTLSEAEIVDCLPTTVKQNRISTSKLLAKREVLCLIRFPNPCDMRFLERAALVERSALAWRMLALRSRWPCAAKRLHSIPNNLILRVRWGNLRWTLMWPRKCLRPMCFGLR